MSNSKTPTVKVKVEDLGITITLAVCFVLVVMNLITAQDRPWRGNDSHVIMKVVHSPRTKEERSDMGRVVFVTGLPTDPFRGGNLYGCNVPKQAYEWAEYMDTIQVKMPECYLIAP